MMVNFSRIWDRFYLVPGCLMSGEGGDQGVGERAEGHHDATDSNHGPVAQLVRYISCK